MGEDATGTNHRARDFRYQHAEKSRLGDVETQGDVFHHPRLRLGCGSLRRVSFRSGSARLGRSQKDGLPSRSWGNLTHLGFKAINARTGEGQPGRCPFKSRAKWPPREHAALFCSPPYHFSAQPSPGLRITLFSPRSLLRLGPSPLSAPQAQGTGANMDRPVSAGSMGVGVFHRQAEDASNRTWRSLMQLIAGVILLVVFGVA